MELDTLLRDFGEHYAHISFCPGDLLIASKDPQKIVDDLMNKQHFNLKGADPMSYHLGCDFSGI